jgi:hypothetical protein
MEIIRGGDVAVAVFEGGRFIVEQTAGSDGNASDSGDVTSFDDAHQPGTPNENNEDVESNDQKSGVRPE